MSKSDYYKETIDWSKVKKFDPIEIIIARFGEDTPEKKLVYFIGKDDDVIMYAATTLYDIERININRCCPLDKSCIVREIDWSKVPVDTKVIVNNGDKILKRYFSNYKNGLIYCFDKGQTSWSSGYVLASWEPHEVELAKSS